jgi:hypothetical protein
LRCGGRLSDNMSENTGSVCARGVVGRREVRLSSDVLLSWRARVLPSPIVSASSAKLNAGLFGYVVVEGASSSTMAVVVKDGVFMGLRTGVGPERGVYVVMALRRWTRSSSRCELSLTGGGRDTLGVMAAMRVNT